MLPSVSVITLGTADLARSRRFYVEGFGWTPVFANEEIIFYQMNGLMLGTFLQSSLEEDMNRRGLVRPGAFTLAHNVESAAAVDAAIARLRAAGATLLRSPDVPPPGGYRGYVADPDDHAWEIAWNPAWTIDAQGLVTFGL